MYGRRLLSWLDCPSLSRKSKLFDPIRSRSSGGEGRSSGSHSNDSGVALLLERAHQAFSADRMSTSPAASTLHRTSDQVRLWDVFRLYD